MFKAFLSEQFPRIGKSSYFDFARLQYVFLRQRYKHLQGSPSDKDIIDLYGHHGLGTMAVNAAMRSRYAAKNGRGLQKRAPTTPGIPHPRPLV